jgi:hypothetical protein
MINFYKINLKYLIIGVAILSILIIAGALIFSAFNKSKLKPTQSTATNKNISPANNPAVQTPNLNSFTSIVKEVKDGILLVETQGDRPQTMEIPLDKNVTFDAWIIENGGNILPFRQKAAATDLKVGQKLEVSKSEAGNKILYEITISNDGYIPEKQ